MNNAQGVCASFEKSVRDSLPKEVCCDCYPNCLSSNPNDPSTKPVPARVSCEMNVTPSIEIDLPQTLNIDETPKMPDITAYVKVTEGATVTWKAQIKYKVTGNCSKVPPFDSQEVTGEGETFTPDFGGIFGGELTMTAKATCPNGKEATATITRTIGGITPSGADVRNEIGALPAPFDPDDLKRIACQESQQTQFLAGNTPKLGPGGDAGIMQICYQRKVDDFWNWKTNIAHARPNLMDKLAYAKNFYKVVRTKVVRGTGPYPDATPLTPDQLRLEAIKRYNAGTQDPDVGYWEWDDEAKTWTANPQGGGDPQYVTHVTSQNPNCRQP